MAFSPVCGSFSSQAVPRSYQSILGDRDSFKSSWSTFERVEEVLDFAVALFIPALIAELSDSLFAF